jgi:hypothetical protein
VGDGAQQHRQHRLERRRAAGERRERTWPERHSAMRLSGVPTLLEAKRLQLVRQIFGSLDNAGPRSTAIVELLADESTWGAAVR